MQPDFYDAATGLFLRVAGSFASHLAQLFFIILTNISRMLL